MNRLKALFCLSGASVIVGSTVLVSRFISQGKSIYCLQFIAMIIASIILISLIGIKQLRIEMRKIQKKDYLLLLFQTLAGVVLFRVFIVYGVTLTKAVDAGIILSLTPISTVTLSVIFLNEKLNKRKLFALSAATIGILIINLAGVNNYNTRTTRLLGNLMIFSAVLGESAFVIFSKKTSSKIPALVRSLYLCIYAAILFVPLSIFELLKDNSFLGNLNFWKLAIYTGAILTALAYILWFKAVPYIDGTTAGIFNSLIPVTSIILVFIFLRENIDKVQLIGLFSILFGVSLVISPPKKEKLNKI